MAEIVNAAEVRVFPPGGFPEAGFAGTLTPGPSPKGEGRKAKNVFALLPSPLGRGAGGEGHWAGVRPALYGASGGAFFPASSSSTPGQLVDVLVGERPGGRGDLQDLVLEGLDLREVDLVLLQARRASLKAVARRSRSSGVTSGPRRPMMSCSILVKDHWTSFGALRIISIRPTRRGAARPRSRSAAAWCSPTARRTPRHSRGIHSRRIERVGGGIGGLLRRFRHPRSPDRRHPIMNPCDTIRCLRAAGSEHSSRYLT